MKAKLISVLDQTTLNEYLANIIEKAISKDEHKIKDLLKKGVKK